MPSGNSNSEVHLGGSAAGVFNVAAISAVLCAAFVIASCGRNVDPPTVNDHSELASTATERSQVDGSEEHDASPGVSDTRLIQAQLHSAGTILARRSTTLLNGGQSYTAVVFRRPVPDLQSDFSQNPCELVVLKRSGSSYRVIARNSYVVDCTDIRFSREMATQPNDLDNYLSFDRDGVITYVNEYENSTSGYSFAYSSSHKEWHLVRAWNAYSTFDVVSDERKDMAESVQYPKDIPYIAMEVFHPQMLETAFRVSRIVE